MSLFLDSGAGLVLSILFALALVLNSEKIFIIAKLMIWVWSGVALNRLCAYRCLLTNRLHGKAAELWDQ